MKLPDVTVYAFTSVQYRHTHSSHHYITLFDWLRKKMNLNVLKQKELTLSRIAYICPFAYFGRHHLKITVDRLEIFESVFFAR